MVFNAKDRLQCARVEATEEREWVRLVALRHDLLLWTPDSRKPRTRYAVPFVNVGQGGWVRELLGLVPLPLTGSLFLDTLDVAAGEVVRGCGVWDGSVKEFVVSRSPPLVLVFNLEEHGRRFYPSLVFASDASRCLHHLPQFLQARSASATAIKDTKDSSGAAAASSASAGGSYLVSAGEGLGFRVRV